MPYRNSLREGKLEVLGSSIEYSTIHITTSTLTSATFESSNLSYIHICPYLIMSTLEDLDDLEREEKEDKKDGDKEKKPQQNGDAEMKDAEPVEKEEDPIDEEIYSLSTQDILTRRRLLENDSRIMKSEFQRLSHEKAAMGEKIKDNLDKIENNR